MPTPTIPEEIIIHLGAPDSPVGNVSETFANYIKNVASSEIYPTWPKEALKANILAQISVALNRVYTRYYRNRGYDFDITNSPAYDQTYIYGREIFENISELVDELFNSYIRREGNVEPLFAEFCDGVEVECQGLEQWGSVSLANEGLGYEEILKRYYGDNIEIVRNAPIASGAPLAPLFPLREGDSGNLVELMQIRLNRISRNYPGIPKVYPVDGFYDASTTNAVRKFQEVFNLTQDGVIGTATWNRINAIYTAVKKLQSVTSEGLRIDELDTVYAGELNVGMQSNGVYALQYYLAYIALFDPRVIAPLVDGDFGAGTKESVESYQRAYGLPVTGSVDQLTWNSIQETYYAILRSIPFYYEEGIILPFPGRVLRLGIEGDDVRALQEYLNYISSVYTSIPRVNPDGIYGPSTAAAVRAFKSEFGIGGNPERVDVVTWDSIISIYDDLYIGNIVRDDQFPGYEVG